MPIFNNGLDNSFGQMSDIVQSLNALGNIPQGIIRASPTPIETQACINHLLKKDYYVTKTAPIEEKKEEKSNEVIPSRPLFGKDRGYNLRGNDHLLDIK